MSVFLYSAVVGFLSSLIYVIKMEIDRAKIQSERQIKIQVIRANLKQKVQ